MWPARDGKEARERAERVWGGVSQQRSTPCSKLCLERAPSNAGTTRKHKGDGAARGARVPLGWLSCAAQSPNHPPEDERGPGAAGEAAVAGARVGAPHGVVGEAGHAVAEDGDAHDNGRRLARRRRLARGRRLVLRVVRHAAGLRVVRQDLGQGSGVAESPQQNRVQGAGWSKCPVAPLLSMLSSLQFADANRPAGLCGTPNPQP